jgi:hypothetical protein
MKRYQMNRYKIKDIRKGQMVSLNKPIKSKILKREIVGKGWYFDVEEIYIKISSRGNTFLVKLEDIEDVR